MKLAELMLLQTQFDRRHSGKAKFYAKITDKNIRELEHLLVCLIGEVGELSNITKKIVRGDISFSQPSVKSHISEEVADVFIYLMKICNQAGIDLEGECLKKLEFNKTRFRAYEKPPPPNEEKKAAKNPQKPLAGL
jgi:NTP pyrophosphatase (non-canonical NTP hydrolase)